MGRPAFRQLRLDQLVLPKPGIRSGRRRLGELAVSIDEIGMLVPLVVRPLSDGKYEVIAGAGRLEALRLSGAGPETMVSCVLVDVDDGEATLLALVENLVREDMRPFDEAETARVLVKDHGYSQERVARALGMDASTVSYWIAVFELDSRVVAALRRGDIEMRTARALMPLRGDGKAQRAMLARIVKERLSAGDVAALVAARMHPKAIKPVRYAVDGAGKIDAKTTRTGKLRVLIEADDRAGLAKLLTSVRKRLL